MNDISFQISPRLTEILGESYQSTELALRELIDNAWDADATEVHITLPEPMTSDPIVVRDNGVGMKPEELRQEYFNIARDRRKTKGDTTQKNNRKCKGRKGIGKFSGLMIADCMSLETTADNQTTNISLRRSAILAHEGELEHFPISSSVKENKSTDNGTIVTLTDLHSHLRFPIPDKVRSILIRDYGREQNFTISVNGEKITFNDIPGQIFQHVISLPNGGEAKVSLVVADGKKKLKNSGLTTKINGKSCGDSSFYGLDKDEILPANLVDRVVGEIEVTTSDESFVTADWGGLIESNHTTIALQENVPDLLRKSLGDARTKEVNLAKARYQKLINRRLAKLPEYRREYARKRLGSVFEMFYNEKEERFSSIISVVLDTFEKDDYWAIIERLGSSKDLHVGELADAITEFGLIDLGIIGRQTKARLSVLDHLTTLIDIPNTTEETVHKILDTNLWIFADAGFLISTNEGIKKVVNNYLGGKYKGNRANKRPDILTTHLSDGRHLLIELKRPSLLIKRKHESQALEYRDDLQPQLDRIEILLLGKGRDSGVTAQNDQGSITIQSYTELISKARQRLEWLIQDLKSDYTR